MRHEGSHQRVRPHTQQRHTEAEDACVRNIQAEQMPTEDIIMMGSSIVNNPEGYTVDGPGSDLDGTYISGGEAVFEADDIVVFVVENVDDNGELTGDSKVVSIIVYDSAADYVNGAEKYTYELNNNGNGGSGGSGRDWTGGPSGDINTNVHNMGDTYLHMRATHFTSDDPDAPDLDYLFLAPGVDLTDDTPDWISNQTDVDYNADGTIVGTEVGDGLFSSDNNIFALEEIANAVCLTRGTLIDTPEGPKYIEALREGDLVNTLDAGPQPVRWIGSRTMPATGAMAPVHIQAGALGNLRDLSVSQNHRMLIRGPKAEILFGQRDVLVAAKHLVNDITIRIVEGAEVEYFHMLFDTHQIIFAEACPTESLFPGEQALGTVTEAARAEILTIFPELSTGDSEAQLSRYELKAWEAEALKRAV